jgi:coproporphyrinogen III oxidase-like Fe-S oxidoreductase
MSNTQQTGDRRIPLDALIRVWQRKLLDNFTEGQEYFNVYVDNPFCETVECRFCGYGPNIVRSRSDKELKDRYYEKILIDHIREFREALSIRGRLEFPYELGANGYSVQGIAGLF